MRRVKKDVRGNDLGSCVPLAYQLSSLSANFEETCWFKIELDYEHDEVNASNVKSEKGTDFKRDNVSDDGVVEACQRDSPLDSVEKFKASLGKVFANKNLTHKQINAVLRVIKKHTCFSSIHVDARTVLHTPVCTVPTKQVAGEEHLYLGIEQALCRILSCTFSRRHEDILQLDFSTDGDSLDNLGHIILWPIQVRIANIANCYPEIVRIF